MSPSRGLGLLFAALFACTLWGCAAASSGEDARASYTLTPERRAHAAAVVAASAETLRELRRAAPERTLDHALTDARAVIVLPAVYSAGFLGSLRGGEGVLVARRPDGSWGAPVFMGLGGAGFGYQVGFEKARYVFVIEEDALLARILQCGLSLDAAAGFDILGVRRTTTTSTLTERRPVLVFSDGFGAMAGVAFHGGLLHVNPGLTAAYHGADAGVPASVLRGADAPGVETFALWGALVENLPRGDAPARPLARRIPASGATRS